MTNKLSPEQSWWGWKLLIVASILSLLFMIIFTWQSTMNLTTCQVRKEADDGVTRANESR